MGIHLPLSGRGEIEFAFYRVFHVLATCGRPSSACITRQYCSAFARETDSCSSVAFGRAILGHALQGTRRSLSDHRMQKKGGRNATGLPQRFKLEREIV